MESFVPSEIARLVYGYLIEENCEAAAQLFLETSSSLKECLVLQKKRRKFNTTVLGLTLVDILNLYTDAVCLVKNYLTREDSLNHGVSELVKELGNVLVIDNDSLRNISKTVFLRISVPNKKNARRSSIHLESIEEEDEDEEEKTEKESQQSVLTKNSIDEETIPAKNTNLSSDEFDLNILQTLIDNTALHERLAENINKAIDSSGETTNHKTDEKKIIETILHNTEADPIFHELLDELVAPRTEDTTTPEDTDKENGDPAEERQVPVDCGHAMNEDSETSKKIAEESNLAIEGILAGNKKMQEEQVNQEPQPTETIVIASPQAVATSSGIYKQYIIPHGYAVTDVFPASQVSTPLQPINMANVATFGHLSPILPQSVSATKQSGSIRGSLQPRRRRILPKAEMQSSFYIQIPSQDDQVQEVKVDIPTPQKRLTENIKGSRVRTRGGIQKVGIRGVKAIVPQMAKQVDSSIQVLVSPLSAKKSNTSGIRTRAMSKRNDKDKKDVVKPSVIDVVQPLTNEEPKQTEIPSEKDPLPEKNIEKTKENCDNEVSEATPQQQTIPKHPRMSLSTPRRSHIRALDFETPEKNLALRKSMTSPKVYQNSKKEPKALEFIKRGGMFSSPPKETPKEDNKPEESKVKKGWDSDLRHFMVSKENLDIPTSVGLKRRAGPRRGDKSANTKRKVGRKKVPKKIPKKKNSNEELVDQIEKDVRDVIGDEEIALNTSNNSELGNLIEQKLMEEMAKNDSSSSLEISPDQKLESEVVKSPGIPEETTSKEITKDVIRKDDEQEHSEPQVRNNEDCRNNAEKHDENIIPEEFNTSTPLKLNMSPVNENSRGQLTPTTKLVMSHLGKVSTRFSSVFSPTSQSSLENILIKECSRMETEKSTSNLAQDIEKPSPPKAVSCDNKETTEDKAAESNKDDTNAGDKQLTFESVCKNSVNLFQTPAKFFSAPIPPGTPVEMTPLTKVLASETSFAATVLVTPTLPPTPKNCSLVTPQKTDESPISSANLSGKETDKPQENTVISSNTNNEKSVDEGRIGNPLSQPDTGVNDPPTLVIDHSKNINDSIEKNKSIDGPSENIDTKSNQVPVGNEKRICKTPKIKLMSPKLNKMNEPFVKKKTTKFIERHKSSEENTSKQTQGLPKVHSDNSVDGKNNEHVIELDSSSHSEKSENNSLERKIEGKINKKPAPQGTKKQTLARKKTCLERNNKSQKKSPKSKSLKKLSVDDDLESTIRDMVKDTKAKLFGPNSSSDSDSDSSINNELDLKKSNVQLKIARERLQKLENIRMLDSSSSSSDGSSDDEAVVKPKVSGKNLKDGIPVKKTEHLNEEDGMKCSSMTAKHSKVGSNAKKVDGGSPSKLIESSKPISKEIEESCESFPTLHLSEESNQSLRLDNNLTKCQKSRKSPLSEIDLAGKKPSSLPSTTSASKASERATVEKAKATNDPRKIPSTTPRNIEGEMNLMAKPKSDHESLLNERFFHIYSDTVKLKFSDSEERLNLARSRALTEYLDNYVYSFTLDVDKSGKYLNKKLRSSPFLHIYQPEFGPIPSHSPHIRKDERRIETPRTDQRPRPRSRTRNRKRSRSASSSEDEKDIRDYSSGYGSFRGGRKRGRDRGRFYNYRGSFDRRDSFPRRKYRDMRSHHDNRCRDYDHYSPYDKKRSRHSSPEFRRNIKKEDRRPLEEKFQSSKYKMYPNVNESFTSSKSGSEVDGRHIDMNYTYSPDINFEAHKERCSTSSSQRLVVDDQPSHSRPQSQSHSRTYKPDLDSTREDGELSDSSEVKRLSPEGSRSAVLTLEAHDSKAKLLNKLGLDQFLSFLHGEEN